MDGYDADAKADAVDESVNGHVADENAIVVSVAGDVHVHESDAVAVGVGVVVGVAVAGNDDDDDDVVVNDADVVVVRPVNNVDVANVENFVAVEVGVAVVADYPCDI